MKAKIDAFKEERIGDKRKDFVSTIGPSDKMDTTE
jgi:hypothetical protein